jgi:cellulose synthase/poly-beta-1,6-N-acetylglucosamine synthase-like glycosyltransferase
MMLRKGLFKLPSELKAFKKALNIAKLKPRKQISARKLNPIEGNPTVSLVIPTMKRQEFTQRLLIDHKNQTYPIKEVVIVDANPEN